LESASKGEENISGMIFVVGIVLVTVFTVALGISMFSNVDIPAGNSEKPSEEFTESDIAGYADQCWREAGKGSALTRMDCRTFQINDTTGIEEQFVYERLNELSAERLGFSDNFFNRDYIEARVSYLPEFNSVNISVVRTLPG
jgi:hypothetical protein